MKSFPNNSIVKSMYDISMIVPNQEALYVSNNESLLCPINESYQCPKIKETYKIINYIKNANEVINM